MLNFIRLLAVVVASVFMAATANAKRVALVIGNDNYIATTKLFKARNDADAMARELRAAGFAVQLHKDLNYREMVKTIDVFANSITGGDEVVVFFAGHGVQIKSGNYLLPVDIEAETESQVEKTAYGLLDLTDKLSEAKAAFSLVVVDACRDNPLKSRGRSVGLSRGLSAIEPAKGQMIVYSASRGQSALDRLNDRDPNPNSVFTREFISKMKAPGVKIEDIVKSVQDSVEALAKTVSKEQRPALYNESRGNFFFYEPTPLQVAFAANVAQVGVSDDRALWDSVKDSRDVNELMAYLNKFPRGLFSEVASTRIKAVEQIVAPQVVAAAPSQLAPSQDTKKRVEFGGVWFFETGATGGVYVDTKNDSQKSYRTTLQSGDRLVKCTGYNIHDFISKVSDIAKCSTQGQKALKSYTIRIDRNGQQIFASIYSVE